MKPDSDTDRVVIASRGSASDSVLPLTVVRRMASREEGGCVHCIARVSEREQAARELPESKARLEGMAYAIAQAMGRAVEARDPYTHGHEVRVAKFARLLAAEMGLSADEIAGVEISAAVHDVGKLSVPAEILNKPGVLSGTEVQMIRRHPTVGYEILKDIAFPWSVAESVLQHHERMDGSGYPQGLAGHEICRTARIIAVADAVEAMASHRPYRPALGVDAAVAELLARPSEYDPEVVEACLELHKSGSIAW